MYEAKLLKYYPQFGLEFIGDELDMAQGWAFLNAATELDGWNQFSGVHCASRGYVGQEVQNILRKKKK